MDKRVTRFSPCTCMCTVNFTLNRFPSNEELTRFDRAVRGWKEDFAKNGSGIRLNDLLLYWRYEQPVYQVFFAFNRCDELIFNTLFDAVDRVPTVFQPAIGVKEIHVTVSPSEL